MNFWSIIFHAGLSAVLTLGPVFVHSLTVNDGTAPIWQQILYIWVAGLGTAGGAFGALVGHHKVTAQKAAELPAVAAPGNLALLCSHLWAEVGVNATAEQVKSIQDLAKGAK